MSVLFLGKHGPAGAAVARVQDAGGGDGKKGMAVLSVAKVSMCCLRRSAGAAHRGAVHGVAPWAVLCSSLLISVRPRAVAAFFFKDGS
jgi:hypothetical protein